MKKLDEYESEIYQTTHTPHSDASGECPECHTELHWADKSLICKNPPMQRVVCPNCQFTKVVPVRE